MSFNKNVDRGFTLIELLVVIAIVAIIAAVVIMTLNPAQLVAQARDSNRLSDLDTLRRAIALYIVDTGGSVGTPTTTYISIPDPTAGAGGNNCSGLGLIPATGWAFHCASTSTYKNVDGTGWLPVNFTTMSSKLPFSALPVDMKNTTSGYYYAYTPAGDSTFSITGLLESTKYLRGVNPNQTYDWARYAVGSNFQLVQQSEGLVRNYLFDEGTGNTTKDTSPYNDTGTFSGPTPYWAPGKIWNAAAQLYNGASIAYSTASGLPNSTTTAITAWIAVTGTHSTFTYLNNNYAAGNAGSWKLWSDSSGNVNFGIYSGGVAKVASGCSSQFSTGANAWHFVVGTYDGSYVRVYLDTVLCQQTALSNQTLYTGGNLSASGSAGQTVYFDDIRLYTRPIPQSEITALYNASN